MKLPRMTTRRWMIGVAIVALMIAVERRHRYCLKRAAYFAAVAEERRIIATAPGMTDWAYANQRKKAAAFDLMKVRYERAAYRFWEPVPAELTRE